MLKNIETELDLPTYYKWLDEEKTVRGPKLSEHARNMIFDVLDNANEDMFNKIDSILKIVKEKVEYIYCIQTCKHCLSSCHLVY